MAGGGEQGPVARPELGAAGLAAQRPKLTPQDEDLQVRLSRARVLVEDLLGDPSELTDAWVTGVAPPQQRGS